MLKNLKIALLCCLFSITLASDIDVVAEAMDKAIIERTKYEALNVQQENRIEQLQGEVVALRLEGIIKDILIVCIAILRINI